MTNTVFNFGVSAVLRIANNSWIIKHLIYLECYFLCVVHLDSNCTVSVSLMQIQQGGGCPWECVPLSILPLEGRDWALGTLWSVPTRQRSTLSARELQNCWMIWVRTDLQWLSGLAWSSNQGQNRPSYSGTCPDEVLIFLRRDFTASPIWLHSWGNLFLISNWNFLCYNLWLLPFILTLCTSKKSLASSSL